VHGALCPDLNLVMDELAHRQRVALAESGQEAAGELLRGQLPTTQVLGQAPWLVAEAGLPCEAEAEGDQAESE
jgi:hypothetical protein